MENSFYKKLSIIGVAIIIAGILCVQTCTVIDPNERGINVTLGKIKGGTLEAGVHLHAPFISKIRTFRLEPKTYTTTFSVGNDGAITKDMQTVGATVAVRYMYDESRIMDIVTTYKDDRIIEAAMQDNIKASLKETTGKYSIYDLVEKQNEITSEVASAMLNRMQSYPIKLSQTAITNWDWSDDFDKQIKETANRTQQVRQAEQEANVAAAQAQKLVNEAKAKKEALQLESEAALIKAQNEAKAKQAEADGIAYYNAKVAQNMTVQKQQWEHEEQMAYYEKWNGILVPNYIPLTAAGGIVNLSQIK